MKKTTTVKRVLALGLSAAMVGTLMAGCGQQSGTSESTADNSSSAATTSADPDKPYAGTTLTWYTKLNANVSDSYANLSETP